MPTFIGYNTIGAVKKFTLTDKDLIIRDLLNAFNIREGELVGRPQYGSNIWSLIFEPMTVDVQEAVTENCRRIILNDPRLTLQSIELFPNDNGMLLEISVNINNNVTAEFLSIFFNNQTNQAGLI